MNFGPERIRNWPLPAQIAIAVYVAILLLFMVGVAIDIWRDRGGHWGPNGYVRKDKGPQG